ncbi:uncharacterized protein LOC120548638 [Perca fluviatilis]|uniref:uncharacterized protein LOC120548638 n=1 Tax=Perca fluviatilis TaxID=8168 RepID=UPI0019646DC3|nr:uncharacterized protein LOC120548638 [Perca fluviatilis]
MNRVSWMTLVVLLSAESSFSWDVNELTVIVDTIRREYRIQEQFCLAANIPLDTQDRNTLSNVLQHDRYENNVDRTLNSGVAYVGTNVVIATRASDIHAEPQVLLEENMETLINNHVGNRLLIYSYLSPCVGRCTNPFDKKFNILKDIRNNVIPYWPNRVAFVFTTVCDDKRCGRVRGHEKPTKDELRESLSELGGTGIGLENIFRCYKPPNLGFECHSCSSNGAVSDVCVQNNFVPGQQSQQRPKQRGRSRSRSRSRDSGRSYRPEKRGRSRSSSSDSGRRYRSEKRGRNRSSSSDNGRRYRSEKRGRNRSSSTKRVGKKSRSSHSRG